MGVSKIVGPLLGSDVDHYSAILDKQKARILRKYKDPRLGSQLDNMGKKFVTLAPIAFCDSMLKDLGIKAPDTLLIGLGLCTLHISAYDDIVDEDPRDRGERAALLYAGNISLLEGIEMLVGEGYGKVMNTTLDFIGQNSLMQQKVVEILWGSDRPNEDQYQKGISHIMSFACIGPMTALAFADRMDLQSRVIRFCQNYGMALQYLDDMKEIEEDTTNGYWSLPRIIAEEKGLKNYVHDRKIKNQLIKGMKVMAYSRISTAKKSTLPKWRNMRDKLSRMEKVIREFEY